MLTDVVPLITLESLTNINSFSSVSVCLLEDYEMLVKDRRKSSSSLITKYACTTESCLVICIGFSEARLMWHVDSVSGAGGSCASVAEVSEKCQLCLQPAADPTRGCLSAEPELARCKHTEGVSVLHNDWDFIRSH